MAEEKPIADMAEDALRAKVKELVSADKWSEAKPYLNELDKREKAEKAKAKAELEKKLEAITSKIMKAIEKAVQPFIDNQELDGADGIWYARDFGDASASCKVIKSKGKAGTGTGNGKSSYIAGFPPNKEMMELVGDEVMFAEETKVTIDKQEHMMPAGMTFKEAEAYSTNGGWRNKVRMALGKAYTNATKED